jgi:putative nucleotidyltransferase with HDIG domain
VALYQLFAVGRFNHPEFRVSAGQVADFELIAPFDFPIQKTEAQLQQERSQALALVEKPYALDPNILFEAHSSIDNLFELLFDADLSLGAASLVKSAEKAGYKLGEEAVSNLGNADRVEASYRILKEEIGKIYRQGIYDRSPGDSLVFAEGSELRKVRIVRFVELEQARKQVTAKVTDPLAAALLRDNLALWVKPNLQISQEHLKDLSQAAINAISTRSGEVLQNEVIIRKNSRITDEDLVKISSLAEAYREREISKTPLQQMFLSLGLLLYILCVILISNRYFLIWEEHNGVSETNMLTLNLGYLLLVGLAILNNYVLGFNNSIIPFAMVTMSVAVLVGFDYAVLFGICGSLILSPFINWEIYTPAILLISTLLAMVLLRRHNQFHEYFQVWLYLFISSAAVNVALSLYKNDQLLTGFRNIGYSVISNTVSVVGMAAIVTYFERKWNRATKQTLLELLDFNHPLLKKLATKAVGTYHHSLIVGNLSERAAEAIGANPLLARVGSYYHDIGKVINTEIFTENNEDSSDIHEQFSPLESASMIRNHVHEGVVLANKYHIPQAVVDIIVQHHGKGKIKFFLDQAQNAPGEVDPADYQYPGPRPQSKEAVLVMLADIVESTTKAKTINSEDDIVKIIDDTIERMISEGQLDEAPITIRELNLAKHSMIPVLESIYRKRLDYPEDRKSE